MFHYPLTKRFLYEKVVVEVVGDFSTFVILWSSFQVLVRWYKEDARAFLLSYTLGNSMANPFLYLHRARHENVKIARKFFCQIMIPNCSFVCTNVIKDSRKQKHNSRILFLKQLAKEFVEVSPCKFLTCSTTELHHATIRTWRLCFQTQIETINNRSFHRLHFFGWGKFQEFLYSFWPFHFSNAKCVEFMKRNFRILENRMVFVLYTKRSTSPKGWIISKVGSTSGRKQ